MSLVKIEFECEDKEEGINKLKEIISKMEQGYVMGEGWEVLSEFTAELE